MAEFPLCGDSPAFRQMEDVNNVSVTLVHSLTRPLGAQLYILHGFPNGLIPIYYTL